jgi:hypothetical protein
VIADCLLELAKDPNFKRYSAVVDRALAAFETIVDWPDYIAFLAKLQKVTQLEKLSNISLVGPTIISYMSYYPSEVSSIQSISAMSKPLPALRGSSEDAGSLFVHLLSDWRTFRTYRSRLWLANWSC